MWNASNCGRGAFKQQIAQIPAPYWGYFIPELNLPAGQQLIKFNPRPVMAVQVH